MPIWAYIKKLFDNKSLSSIPQQMRQIDYTSADFLHTIIMDHKVGARFDFSKHPGFPRISLPDSTNLIESLGGKARRNSSRSEVIGVFLESINTS
jgi:hypothetical protein